MIPVVVTAWLLFGLGVAVVMIRAGHAPVIWLSLVPYGPLSVLLALSAHDAERWVHPLVRSEGSSAGGPVDVIVGVDGSAEALAAIEGLQGLLGDRVGRLTLASVVDFDVDQLPGRAHPRERADRALAAAAARAREAGEPDPATVVLTGRPDLALIDYALAEGIALVAAGRRGHGATRHLVGSTATRLAADGRLPVVLFGGERGAGEDPGPVPTDAGAHATGR